MSPFGEFLELQEALRRSLSHRVQQFITSRASEMDPCDARAEHGPRAVAIWAL